LPMAWLTGWGFRKQITIQDTYVDSNLTDFPVYVHLDADADFHESESTGYDIRFTQSDGTTLLKYERPYWTGGNGSAATAHLFVKVPSILASGGATIYIYYGKTGAPDGADAANTWNSDFQAVWHLHEASGTRADSSGNSNTLQDNATVGQVNGKVYKAADFEDDNSEYLSITDALQTGLDLNNDWTVTAWWSWENEWQNNPLISKGYWGGSGHAAVGQIYPEFGLEYYNGTTQEIEDSSFDTSNTDQNVFYYYSATYNDATNDVIFGRNGSFDSALTMTVDFPGDTNPVYVGRFGTNYLDGWIEELRVSDIVRPSAWMKFEYYNMDDGIGDNELTWASEEVSGLSLIKIINETLQFSEGALRPRVMLRIRNETVQLNEGILRPRAMFRLVPENVQLGENTLRIRGLVRFISETLGISENVARLKSMVRAIDETLQISEVVLKFRGIIRTINETLNISEGIVRLRGLIRTIDETLNVSEGILRFRTLLRIIGETLQIVESEFRSSKLVKVVNETVNVVEGIVKKLTGAALIKIINETLQVSEGVLRFRGLVRRIAETLQISEGSLRLRVLVRRLNESLNIQEGILGARSLIRIVSETLNIQENVARLKSVIRVINETLQLSETALQVLGFVRVVTETLNISEGIVKLKGIVKWVNETISIVESTLSPRTLIRIISEALSIQENILRLRTMLRMVGENVAVSEGSLTRRAITRVVDETVQLTEGVIRYFENLIIKIINETVNIQEGVLKAVFGFVAASGRKAGFAISRKLRSFGSRKLRSFGSRKP
jgi:uncharacterized protein YjeT (DUF2065 family)